MTSSISSFYHYGEEYSYDIRVDNPDGRYYFKSISIHQEFATEENLDFWKQVAIDEAISYWESL